MIGTGAFTALGFQLEGTTNTWSILFLWVSGGLMALSGAFCYAELGKHFKRSGGEYHYLSELFHPILGYLSGWVSLTVGFSAPIALAAMALSAYLDSFFSFDSKIVAIAVVVVVSLVHSFHIKSSSRFQNVTTALKVLLILVLVCVGLFTPVSHQNALDWSSSWQHELFTAPFAVSLIYVSYSYSGWNAATYIAEEIENVEVNLPKALLRGTFAVTILYVLLQLVFLRHAPLSALQGKVEVGQVVAEHFLGVQGGQVFSLAIALFLISSISAMVWVGPRVSLVMAEDYHFWSFLNRKNSGGVPVRAVWFQTILSISMILTGTFEAILLYCGFILQIFSALSVYGLFHLSQKTGKKLPWYISLAQYFFLALSVWILFFLITQKPQQSLWGFSNILLGLATYWICLRMDKKL